MPEDYFKMLGQELEVCGMGSLRLLEASWFFHLPTPPGIPIPLRLFEAPSGQQGGVHAIKRAILFQTDKNALQHLSHARSATNKTF